MNKLRYTLTRDKNGREGWWISSPEFPLTNFLPLHRKRGETVLFSVIGRRKDGGRMPLSVAESIEWRRDPNAEG